MHYLILYYHVRYPNNLSAIQMYVAEPGSDLPQGPYAFLESYCCNPEGECKKVKIEIVKQSSMNLDYFEISELTAVLEYEWEIPLSEQNPKLADNAYQSEWAMTARQVFIDYVEADPHYKNRLSQLKFGLIMVFISGF